MNSQQGGTPDIIVSNQGTLFIFVGATVDGQEWLDDNLATPSWSKLGSNHAVEHRYAKPIIDGAEDAGLQVEEW